MQNELSSGKLLDQNGSLCEAGYAKNLIKEYHREDIKAPKLRIKEWDYYYVGNNEYGIAFTISDNSYMGLMSISLLDFRNQFHHTKSVMTILPKGKTKLPSTSKIGDVHFKNSNLTLDFLNDGKTRHLQCEVKNFYQHQPLYCDIILDQEPLDSMCIAKPFFKPKYFYYNQKINCLKAHGLVMLGTTQYDFFNSWGVLDWGRGVWPYKNLWYWASMSGVIDGKTVGFNLGYGFGDTSKGTENMLFYDGKGYKIDQVAINIPKNSFGQEQYLQNWTITSPDDSINLEFVPTLDRYANISLIFLSSLQHQVFGTYNGYIKINDQIIGINNIMGFAEKVKNKW